MTSVKKVGDLEVDEDMQFQGKEWVFGRVGWIAMLVIILAALLGLFGQGPLSSVTVKNGSLQVKYDRFERLLANDQIEIQLDKSAIQNGEARIQIDQSLFDYYTILRIMPQPDSEELAADHQTYVYKVSEPGDQMSIMFALQQNQMGFAQGKISAGNGSTVEVKQFIFP